MNYYLLLSLERPLGLVGIPERVADLTFMLPRKAQDKGMVMLDIIYRQPESIGKDPLIIFDREGKIQHMWPDDYFPGPFEIKKVCRRIFRRQK